MLAFDPTHGIVYLVNVIRKLGVTTIVENFPVWTAEEFETREGGIIHTREPDFRRKPLADAVRTLSTVTSAKSNQKLIDHGRTEDVIVAESYISSILGSARPENR